MSGVPQPPGHRRVARKGAHHRALPRRRLHRRIVGRATSATSPPRRPRCPRQYKKEKWANLGVDVDNHFKPLYVVSPNKKDHVRHLKAALKDATELYLATDEDREGEAIALAPPRGAEPQGPRQADGLPRDHARGDPARHRQPPRARPSAGRRPGGAAHLRPPLRLRGQPRPVEEDPAGALGRPGAVGGHPDRRRA